MGRYETCVIVVIIFLFNLTLWFSALLLLPLLLLRDYPGWRTTQTD